MTVTSADEFYSIMGVLTREMLEFTDTNNLIKVETIIHTKFDNNNIFIERLHVILHFSVFTIILSIINVFDIINNNSFT